MAMGLQHGAYELLVVGVLAVVVVVVLVWPYSERMIRCIIRYAVSPLSFAICTRVVYISRHLETV